MNPDDRLIWAAGFFDGEGSVAIKHHNKTGQFHLAVSVAQVVLDPLEILLELFGGSLQQKRSKNGAWADIYSWNAASRQAAAALERMRPWLVVKAGQADLAAEFTAALAARGGGHVRGAVKDTSEYERCRNGIMALNARGPRRPHLALLMKSARAS